MKKVNKTDAATLLNNFKVELYITALTAVEVVLITHSVMYCGIFSWPIRRLHFPPRKELQTLKLLVKYSVHITMEMS